MNEYMISVDAAFVGPPNATDDDFERFINATAREFEAIGCEVVVLATAAQQRADFTALVEGETELAALSSYLVNLRTALHAAGCATPGWPVFAIRDQEVREVQLV